MSGVKKADADWWDRSPYNYNACRPYCGYGFWEHLEPWPFREHAAKECPVAGSKDKCTGEIYNGQWWYKPQGDDHVK